MNTLDIVMLVPLAWGAFNGYRKGLLVEIVAVIAFVVAMIVGFKFLAFGIELLSPYISREIARKNSAVAGIFYHFLSHSAYDQSDGFSHPAVVKILCIKVRSTA